ncbi:MAG: carboxypeptidase regulatory-like domain-containing protein [Ruminococcus sp.]|nr:carboxypeptidase regulatory-like domain-containing protein [Ruminococcus sp.]
MIKRNLVKKLLSATLSVAMLVCLIVPNAVSAITADTSWYNSTDTSFTITTATQLAGLASLVNNGDDFSGKTIKLGNDIDLNGENWTPIGTYSSYPFNGTFDGQKYTVSNLYINDTTSDGLGLFGYVGSSGTVQNITVNGTVTGSTTDSSDVGGVVGVNAGTVTYCNSSVTVQGKYYSGGVVGYNDGGSVTGCSNSGTVIGARFYTGGVVGYNKGGSVTNCYNSGSVSGTWAVGGVVGYNLYSSTSNCYNYGSVSGDGEVGGVIGTNYTGVSTLNSYYLESTATAAIGQDYSSSSTTNVAVKNAAEFASGEVAYLLNESVSGGTTWYQNLDNGEAVDSYPVLDSTHGTVYYGTNCAGTIIIYSNSTVASGHTTEIQNAKEATGTEDGYTGDEVCTVCGEVVKYGEVIPALGLDITGTINVSDEDATTEMTVTAVAEDGTETSVTATSMGEYTIEGLASGTYTLVVSGGKYVPREYSIEVDTEDITQDVSLNPYGDVNGDGKATTADVGLANSHAKGVNLLEDYEFDCADVNIDGSVTTADVGKINSHAKGVALLW